MKLSSLAFCRFTLIALFFLTLFGCNELSKEWKEKGENVGKQLQEGGNKLLKKAEEELPRHGSRIINKAQRAKEAAKRGADFLEKNIQELQGSQASLLQGFLRSGDGGARIAHGHVFALTPDGSRVLAHTRTIGVGSENTGRWYLSGLPIKGQVVLVGFAGSNPLRIAVLAVSMTGGSEHVEGFITQAGRESWNEIERNAMDGVWSKTPGNGDDYEALASWLLATTKQANATRRTR